jgi:hypothetical protein
VSLRDTSLFLDDDTDELAGGLILSSSSAEVNREEGEFFGKNLKRF